MRALCLSREKFSQLKEYVSYEIKSEFIVKFRINCKSKKEEYREVEMIETEVWNYLKSRFDLMWVIV